MDSNQLTMESLSGLKPDPLVYPPITEGHTNILLVDNAVTDYNTFVDSVNSSTLPIVYSVRSSKTELL
jgi:hypothetical protein